MEILYEDNDLLVINKPAGMVVNRAETVTEPTVQEWHEQRVVSRQQAEESSWQELVPEGFTGEFGAPEEIFKERGGIVHRLDKDTSGVLVLAKNPGSLVNLLAQFKERTTRKTYRCLAHGKFKFEKGTVSSPLGRASGDRKKFAVIAEGRPAETEYRVDQYYPHLNVEQVVKDHKSTVKDEELRIKNFSKRAKIYQGFSMVTCWPKTGRTHQIRVHLKHLGHPLVGDMTYLGHKRAGLDPVWCSRQFLHASEIVITHPRTHEEIRVAAPLTDDLQETLRYLQT